MAKTVEVIKELAEMKKFVNEKGIIEIVVRGRNNRIKAFQKAQLADMPEQAVKEMADKMLQALNTNTHFSKEYFDLMQKMASSQQLGVVLNGLNLCVSSAGFAVLYAKMDAMSSEINQQLNQVQDEIHQSNDIQSMYEFNKVLADYTDMLDSKRRKQPYSENRMRDLVDREYNVLTMLVSIFQKQIASDNRDLINSIFSLLSMFTVSLCDFDEQYYFNNHDVLGDMDAWHSSHVKWMGIYDTLSASWFMELLQDHGMFETNLSVQGVDMYYLTMLDQVRTLRQTVEDNQTMIQLIGDEEALRNIKEASEAEVKEIIGEALDDAFKESDAPAAKEYYQQAMRNAVLA